MISFKIVNTHLRYEPATGLLWWIKAKKGRQLQFPAGRRNKNRHVTICIDRQHYMAHQLIWLLQTGTWPKTEIDHKNRKRADNRWCNLRLATTQQNRFNSSVRKDNTSGFKGVSWHALRNKWRARIYIDGKEKHLGLFKSAKEAHTAYKTVCKKTRGIFSYTG